MSAPPSSPGSSASSDIPELGGFKRLQNINLALYNVILHGNTGKPSKSSVTLVVLSTKSTKASSIATSLAKQRNKKCLIYWFDGFMYHKWSSDSKWMASNPHKQPDPSKQKCVYIHDFRNDLDLKLYDQFSTRPLVPVSSVLISPHEPNLEKINISDSAPYIEVKLLDDTTHSVPILYKEFEKLSIDWDRISDKHISIRKSVSQVEEQRGANQPTNSTESKEPTEKYEPVAIKPSKLTFEDLLPNPSSESLLPENQQGQRLWMLSPALLLFFCIIGLVVYYNGVDCLWPHSPSEPAHPILASSKEVLIRTEHRSLQNFKDGSNKLKYVLMVTYEFAKGKLSEAKALILDGWDITVGKLRGFFANDDLSSEVVLTQLSKASYFATPLTAKATGVATPLTRSARSATASASSSISSALNSMVTPLASLSPTVPPHIGEILYEKVLGPLEK